MFLSFQAFCGGGRALWSVVRQIQCRGSRMRRVGVPLILSRERLLLRACGCVGAVPLDVAGGSGGVKYMCVMCDVVCSGSIVCPKRSQWSRRKVPIFPRDGATWRHRGANMSPMVGYLAAPRRATGCGYLAGLHGTQYEPDRLIMFGTTHWRG